MKWFAYDPDDSDRSGADPIYGFLTPSDVAAEFAKRCYNRESFDKYMDVVVVQVSADGNETHHRYTVDVVHEPLFRARRT